MYFCNNCNPFHGFHRPLRQGISNKNLLTQFILPVQWKFRKETL
jgi:hypothetical protein